MFIMDFKGITWAGNVYQKFEAMCLEVEEAVCQDTVKFVENQAQTVGSSVKKFYSDVMQDLLPPSSIDPVKLAAADLSLNPYADFGISKKPKASIKKDTVKTDKKVSEDLTLISGVNTDFGSSFSGLQDVNRFQPPYSMGGPVTGTGLELCLEQTEHRGAYKRKSRRYNYRPSEIPRSITFMSDDMSKLSSNPEITENHGVPCGQIAMISDAPAVDTGCHSSGANSRTNVSGSSTLATAGDSIGTSTPNIILPVESGMNNESKLRCTTLNGGPDMLEAELNGACANSGAVSTVRSYINGDQQDSEKASEARLSPTGGCNLDGNENGNVLIEPGFESCNEPLDKSKLEETCVLVDTQEICPSAHRKDKPRSYKKKIQKAFSSKRSARKQEYEQLAVQHGDMEAKSSPESAKTLMLIHGDMEAKSNQESAKALMFTFTTDSDTKKSLPRGISESEWELL